MNEFMLSSPLLLLYLLLVVSLIRALQLGRDLEILKGVAHKVIRGEQLERGIKISSSGGRSLLNRLVALRIRIANSHQSRSLFEQLLSIERIPEDLSLKGISAHLLETVRLLVGESLQAGRIFSFKNGTLELLASLGSEAATRLDSIIHEELTILSKKITDAEILVENTFDLATFQIASSMISRSELLGGEQMILWLGFKSDGGIPSGENRRLLSLVTSRTRALLEQARLIDTLKQQNRSDKDHLVGLSHDLRSPGISALYVLRRILDSGREDFLSLREVELLLVEQQSLIADYLDLAREEKDLLCAVAEKIDLDMFLKSIADSPILKYHGKPISIQFPKGCSLEILFDPRHLKRILLNLLTNSLKFTNHGSVILAITSRSNSSFAISVIDTGQGISEKLRSGLFQPFRRLVDNVGTVGEGIGLAASQALARANGASLSFEANHPVGSIFSLELPNKLVTEMSSSVKILERRVEGESHSQYLKLNILVVDDDEATCRLYARIITAIGYGCTQVGSIEAALGTSPTFDAIVTDYKLIDGGCDRLLRELARRGTVPPTLIVSGASDWAELDTLKKLYEIDFLEKPIERDQFEQRVHKLFNQTTLRFAGNASCGVVEH